MFITIRFCCIIFSIMLQVHAKYYKKKECFSFSCFCLHFWCNIYFTSKTFFLQIPKIFVFICECVNNFFFAKVLKIRQLYTISRSKRPVFRTPYVRTCIKILINCVRWKEYGVWFIFMKRTNQLLGYFLEIYSNVNNTLEIRQCYIKISSHLSSCFLFCKLSKISFTDSTKFKQKCTMQLLHIILYLFIYYGSVLSFQIAFIAL